MTEVISVQLPGTTIGRSSCPACGATVGERLACSVVWRIIRRPAACSEHVRSAALQACSSWQHATEDPRTAEAPMQTSLKLSQLPDDLLQHVLGRLEPCDLANARLACRQCAPNSIRMHAHLFIRVASAERLLSFLNNHLTTCRQHEVGRCPPALDLTCPLYILCVTGLRLPGCARSRKCTQAAPHTSSWRRASQACRSCRFPASTELSPLQETQNALQTTWARCGAHQVLTLEQIISTSSPAATRCYSATYKALLVLQGNMTWRT